MFLVFFFQAEDGIRDGHVTGVQTCALPISLFTAGRCAQPEHVARSAGQHVSPERERWHTWPRYTARSVFDENPMTSEPGLSAVMGWVLLVGGSLACSNFVVDQAWRVEDADRRSAS